MKYILRLDHFSGPPIVLHETKSEMEAVSMLRIFTQYYGSFSSINKKLVYLTAKEEKEDEQK